MTEHATGRGARGRENALVALFRIPVFRRMWAAITFSSFGDWLGLLANTALAQQLTASSRSPRRASRSPACCSSASRPTCSSARSPPPSPTSATAARR